MLRVIQLNTLEDRAVHDKYQWDSAINFLEQSLQEKLKISQANLREQVGPGFYERWFQWSGSTPEQDKKSAIYYELERILKADVNHKAVLSFEELTTVKRNLQTDANIEVDYELIRETWHPVYRTHFLQKAINRCYDCRRGFFMYSKGIENDVSNFEKIINKKFSRFFFHSSIVMMLCYFGESNKCSKSQQTL